MRRNVMVLVFLWECKTRSLQEEQNWGRSIDCVKYDGRYHRKRKHEHQEEIINYCTYQTGCIASRRGWFQVTWCRKFIEQLDDYQLFMGIISKLLTLIWECGSMEGVCGGGGCAASTPCVCYVIRPELYWSISDTIFNHWTRPWG
jgi:hypothetical protein